MNIEKRYQVITRNASEERCIDFLKKHPFLLEATIDDEKNTPFLLACHRAHFNLIDYLVEKGVNVHLSNSLQENAFALVVHTGNMELWEKLYSLGIDFDQKDADGYTPLLEACSFNRSSMIKFLIEKGADVNIQSGKDSVVGFLKEGEFELEFSFILKHFDKFNKENQKILKGLQLKNLVTKGSI